MILKIILGKKAFIPFQINQTALKSGYKFTTYDKFTDTSCTEELQTRKPLSPIWASVAQYLKSVKRRVLNPCVTYKETVYTAPIKP